MKNIIIKVTDGEYNKLKRVAAGFNIPLEHLVARASLNIADFILRNYNFYDEPIPNIPERRNKKRR